MHSSAGIQLYVLHCHNTINKNLLLLRPVSSRRLLIGPLPLYASSLPSPSFPRRLQGKHTEVCPQRIIIFLRAGSRGGGGGGGRGGGGGGAAPLVVVVVARVRAGEGHDGRRGLAALGAVVVVAGAAAGAPVAEGQG